VRFDLRDQREENPENMHLWLIIPCL